MRTLIALSVTTLLVACCAGPTEPSSIDNFRQPLPDIDTAGQPTEAQFDALPAAGYSRVVHVRPASEPGTGWEEARAKEIGIEFVRIPVGSSQDLSRELVDVFAEAVDTPTSGRVLVSCRSGNRSGAMLALKACWKHGATVEDALALGRAAGMTRAEKRVRELLQ